MTGEKIYDIENIIGAFFHYLYAREGHALAQLFAQEAVMEFPDVKMKLEGAGIVRKYWEDMDDTWGDDDVGKIKTVYMPCDVYVVPEGQEMYGGASVGDDVQMFYGQWDTYSFRCESAGKIQYFITHGQAWFVYENHMWKFKKLRWNEILELVPWNLKNICCPIQNSGRRALFSELNDHTLSGNVCDYMAVRNLAGHFTHEGMDRKVSWFSKKPDVRLKLPTLFEKPLYGYDQIEKGVKWLKQLELENDKNYVFLPVLCAPLIIFDTGGKEASGQWLVLAFEVKAKAFGHKEPPYEIAASVGCFEVDFIKEDGQWHFLTFDHKVLYSMIVTDHYIPEAGGRHRMREKQQWDNTWLPGPEETGGLCALDVNAIEMTMVQWTGRLRSGNSMDFVDRFMVNSVKDISMLVAGTRLWPTCGYENIQERFGKKEPSGDRENPVFHMTATPVIEFSPDGQGASAAWTDFAIADFSGTMGYPAYPICYYATVNKYYHQYVRDHGQWKLYAFGWEPGIFLGGLLFEKEHCRGFYKGWEHTKYPMPGIGEPYIYEK